MALVRHQLLPGRTGRLAKQTSISSVHLRWEVSLWRPPGTRFHLLLVTEAAVLAVKEVRVAGRVGRVLAWWAAPKNPQRQSARASR